MSTSARRLPRTELAPGTIIQSSEKGAANGVATLDATGKLPAGQLSPSVVSNSGIAGAGDKQAISYDTATATIKARSGVEIGDDASLRAGKAGADSGAVLTKFGNATDSSFTGEPDIHNQMYDFFARNGPLTGPNANGRALLRPQGFLATAVYFNKTLDDTAQGGGCTAIVGSLAYVANASTGQPIVQDSQPVVGDEGDALVQGASEVRQKAIGQAAAAQAQGSAYIQTGIHYYASAKGARDAAGTARTLSGAQAVVAAPTTFTLTLDATPSDWASQGKVTLVDGGNTCVVYYQAISGAQLTGCTLRTGDTARTYANGSAAARTACIVDQHYSFYAEDAKAGSSGLVRRHWAFYGKGPIQTESHFWMGTFLTGGDLVNALSVGATSMTVSAGQGANFASGNPIVLGSGPNEEVVYVSGAPVGDVVSFGACLFAHPAGERVFVASQAANVHYNSGAVRTDMSLSVRQTCSAGAMSLLNNNGSGTFQLATQSAGTPGTPSSGQVRFYSRGSDGHLAYKTSSGTEYDLLRLSTPAAAISSPAADVNALKTAVDAIRVAIQNANITS